MSLHNPQRGEIWQVNFSPQLGDEIRSQHPAVVVSTQTVGILQLRSIVPITDAKGDHAWLVDLFPGISNGLTKHCVADAFQCKSISLERFMYKRGIIDQEDFDDIMEAVLLCLGL
jgi:mRNA interferase MazF